MDALVSGQYVIQFLFFSFSIPPSKRLLSSYTFCGWTKNVLINFQWGPNWADRGKTHRNKVNLELMFLLIYCLNINGRECMKVDKLMWKPCWLDLMNEFLCKLFGISIRKNNARIVSFDRLLNALFIFSSFFI